MARPFLWVAQERSSTEEEEKPGVAHPSSRQLCAPTGQKRVVMYKGAVEEKGLDAPEPHNVTPPFHFPFLDFDFWLLLFLIRVSFHRLPVLGGMVWLLLFKSPKCFIF